MIRKFLLLFINIIAAVGLLNAQTDAKRVLDDVNNKIKLSKGISANFSYTTKDFNNNNLGVQQGQILIKGGSYYITQGNTEIISNGETIWNYNGEDEVMVSDTADESNKFLSPRHLFSGEYNRDFTYRLIPSRSNFYIIQMYPVDKRKIVKQIVLYIDKSQNLITKATVIDRGSNILSFTFTNITTSTEIDDKKFNFDAARHPGVEVIKH